MLEGAIIVGIVLDLLFGAAIIAGIARLWKGKKEKKNGHQE